MLFPNSVYLCAFTVAILATGAAAVQGKPKSICREPTAVQNFNITRFLGQWYMYSHYDHEFERGCDCFSSEAIKLDENKIKIANCCQMTKGRAVIQNCRFGVDSLQLVSPEKEEASFVLTTTGVTVASQAWIIDIDYENYLVAYGCHRVSDEEERELLWILTRATKINEMTTKKIDDVLNANHFEKDKIIGVKNTLDICKRRKNAKWAEKN